MTRSSQDVALNTSSGPGYLAKLSELQAYMGLRQMHLVPTLASGSGGYPTYGDNSNLAEGKWVRDEPFVFNANDSATAVMPAVTGYPTNGDFGQLKEDGSPTHWYTTADAAGAVRWSVDNASVPTGGVRSMRCAVDKPIDCSGVPAGKSCESGSLVSDHFEVEGGGVAHSSCWGRGKGGHARGCEAVCT